MKALEDFGIKLNWKFDFRAHGSTLEPLPNTMFVDVGNQLTEGIIDTHQGTKYKSSAHALSENPHLILNHLLKGLNEAYARGEKDRLENLQRGLEFTFVTHTSPDWDSIATLFLCDKLVKTGRLPDEHKILIEATNQIDQGMAKMEGKIRRPFMIYYQISAAGDGGEHLLAGKKLIKDIFSAIKNNGLTGKGNPFLEYFEDLGERLPGYQECLSNLEADKEIYETDLQNTITLDVELPCKKSENGEEFEKKTALAFTREPKCKLHKYWARDKGEDPKEPQLLLIPHNFRDKARADQIQGWIISVDPTKKYCLRRLGYCLENKETEKRSEEHKRHGEPRWDDTDYSNNSDPWYDGRDHDYTIVGGPSEGTRLDLEDIKSVLKQRFHGIQIEESSSNNLVFYFFFEIQKPDGGKRREDIRKRLKENVGFSKKHVLSKLNKAFQFIKEIELWSMEYQLDENNDFSATLWASEITRHCVLQLKANDFHEIMNAHAKTPVILEELSAIVERIEELAKKTAYEIREDLEMEGNIWGQECFRLVELTQPDLKFHSEDKVKNAFNKLLRDELPEKQINRLIRGEGAEQVRTSHALCVLNKAHQNAQKEESSQRQLMLFYSLFLKTGYRNFSERIGDIVDYIINPDNNEYHTDITEIQQDYSAFLGRYEFSEREINTDGGLQKFFNRALEALGFREQRDETRHEMETTFQLAAAENRKTIEKGNTLLNCLILGLGILALGDFVHAWRTSPEEQLSIGTSVVVMLFIVAGVASVALWYGLRRNRDK